LSYTSSSSPAINKLRRLLSTSASNSPWSGAGECIALGARTVHSTRWSQILAQYRQVCLLHLRLMPPVGGPRRNIDMTFCTEKQEWFDYTNVDENSKILIFILTEFTNVTDGRTGRLTDRRTPHEGIGRACRASRGSDTVNALCSCSVAYIS